MKITREKIKNWWRRQSQPTPRSGKLMGYIFAWMMVTGGIRIAYFRFENFWIDLGAIMISLMIGDFIGSRTFDSFTRFVHKIRSSRP